MTIRNAVLTGDSQSSKPSRIALQEHRIQVWLCDTSTSDVLDLVGRSNAGMDETKGWVAAKVMV
jgi:hypothetical protein